MAQIDELIVKIKGDISDLKTKLTNSSKIANTTFSKIGKSVGKVTGPVSNVLGKFNNLAGVLGVTAGAAGFGAVVNKSLDSADALAKLSGQLGLTAEFLQEMRFAASQTGVEQGAFDQSLRLFTKNIGEANDGVATYSDEFKKLGVELRDNNGNLKNTEVLFREVADGIKNLPTDTEKASTAFALFGRSGIQLVNTLKNGSAGLSKYQEEARALGIVMDGDLLKNAEEANDKFDVLSRIVSTQVTTAVVDLAPHLVNLANTLIDASKGAVQLGKDLGLIDEKDPAKKIQGIKAEIIDLEQEVMQLEQSDGFLDSLFKDSRIESKRKAIEELKSELATIDDTGGGGAVKSAQIEQDTITEIQRRGMENRAEMRAEQEEKEKEEEAKKLEEMIAKKQEESALLSELDFAANQEKIEANNEFLKTMEDNQALSEEARLKLKANRLRKEREMEEQAVAGLSSIFGDIMTLSKGQNRELFEISKAASTATAIVQGVLGVQRALGSAPPPLNFINATAVGTAAAVNVAKIQGTTFNKGTDSVPGIGNFDTVPAILTPGERVVPKETNKDLTSFLSNQKASTPIMITVTNNFNGLSFDSDEAKLQLAESLNEVTRELGARIIL